MALLGGEPMRAEQFLFDRVQYIERGRQIRDLFCFRGSLIDRAVDLGHELISRGREEFPGRKNGKVGAIERP
jgi:hypothetical protein